MTTVTEILEAHPVRDDIDDAVLAACIQACAECTQACTSCADACLGESGVEHLVECIRADLDCADLCSITERVLLRRTEASIALVRETLEACAIACGACADECAKHADMHQHCRICADVCRRCEEACRRLLEVLG
ncbi:four-helix bundle copper-binding protein [Gordonia sp. 135]|uniref:four-helix bundle copper-binding protein n=1 Tax=Gordonia sp. 135 TaxID=2676309 RepID=UPI0012BB325B|nr:four-helix bundle copper-binding protein [Gordonia sp. 135]QGP86387.1 four-helix bundle copper-binding protein [Gordonia sp. 135]